MRPQQQSVHPDPPAALAQLDMVPPPAWRGHRLPRARTGGSGRCHSPQRAPRAPLGRWEEHRQRWEWSCQLWARDVPTGALLGTLGSGQSFEEVGGELDSITPSRANPTCLGSAAAQPAPPCPCRASEPGTPSRGDTAASRPCGPASPPPRLLHVQSFAPGISRRGRPLLAARWLLGCVAASAGP